MFEFSAGAGLIGLFVSSFVSATVLPGGSELVLIAVIREHPQLLAPAIAVATVGNTLGAMSSYLLGRLIPSRVIPNRAGAPAMVWLHRYGYWTLLFSWLPIIGDALCVAAGWLRFHPLGAALAIAAGKCARYALVAGGWSWLVSMSPWPRFV